MNTDNEESTQSETSKQELREQFKRSIGIILARNGLTHKALAAKI
jgi:hypothetical protein